MAAIKVYETIDLNIDNKFLHKKSGFQRNKKTLDDYKKQISSAINKIGGRYVKFDDVNHTEGLMVAGIIMDSEIEKLEPKEKVYFAIMNRDKHMVYINNNEHFNVLQDIPSSLYILDYLYKHEPEVLRDYAEHAFETDKVEVFTDICIKIPTKKINKNNKKKQNKKHN